MHTSRPCLHCWRGIFLLSFPLTYSWSHEWCIKYERLMWAIPEKLFHGFPWLDFELKNKMASNAKFINLKNSYLRFESTLLRANLSSEKPQTFVGILLCNIFFYMESHKLIIVANIRITRPTPPFVRSTTTNDLSLALWIFTFWHFSTLALFRYIHLKTYSRWANIRSDVSLTYSGWTMDDTEKDQKLFVRAFAGICCVEI